METGECPDYGRCAAADVRYLSTGAARAAAVLAAGTAFARVLAARAAVVPRVPPGRPGESCRRELPPLRAVPDDLTGWACWRPAAAGLDPGGRPGLGAHAHAGSGIAVIGVARSRFRTAAHAVPVVRRSSGRPFVRHRSRDPRADAAGLVRRMAGRYRLPGAVRRAGTLARAGPPVATRTGRQAG